MNYVDQVLNRVEAYVKPQGIKILSLIGLLYTTTTAFRILRSFSRTFLLFSHNLPERYGLGSWAVITGGASGIGAAFAEKLGSLGFNLVLIDVNEVNLAATALTVEAKFPRVQVKTITSNFSKSFQEGFYDNLLKGIEGLDVSILINNVGTGVPPMSFHLAPEKAILNTIIVNTVPMTIMSRRLIPSMLKRTKKSAIINLSSITGVNPVSILATYSATKSYVDTLSRMIEEDVRGKIDVFSVRPDAVSTPMIRNPKIGKYIISPETAASGVLGKLGRTPYAHGNWRHEVKGWLQRNAYLNRYFTNHFIYSVLGLPRTAPSK